jgi:hypothetical protein
VGDVFSPHRLISSEFFKIGRENADKQADGRPIKSSKAFHRKQQPNPVYSSTRLALRPGGLPNENPLISQNRLNM